jgi:hypothetical protein
MDEVSLNLTVAQVNVILHNLSRGAFAEVADLIAEIRKQVVPQLPKPEEPAAE